MNSQEVSYQFGQLGSAYVKLAAHVIVPPDGMVIVAIQFLDTLKMDKMKVDQSVSINYGGTDPGETKNSFFGMTNGNSGAAYNGDSTSGRGVEVVVGGLTTGTEFPKGITVYGRWTEVSLATSGENGIICYFGV
tara:strand:+ start:620 stop:1021 length:402 start_codon:yes stop_codon:yes gene_type:complete